MRTGVRVDRLSRQGEGYLVEAGNSRFEAEHVIVAMASYQRRRVPSFAPELDPGVVQLHSSDYRNLSQLRSGGVLIVGSTLWPCGVTFRPILPLVRALTDAALSSLCMWHINFVQHCVITKF